MFLLAVSLKDWDQYFGKKEKYGQGVILHEHTNYSGRSAICDVGNYDINSVIALIGNDAISSITIPSGYGITVYEHIFGGASATFTKSIPNLLHITMIADNYSSISWNDQISSFTVFRVDSSGRQSQSILPLTEFNNHNRACARDLVFTKTVDKAYNAAQRAMASKEEALGTCQVNISTNTPSPELALIEENTFSYILKSVCVTLNYKSLNIENNKITITFRNDGDKTDDTVRLMYLLFLNPVFVEFNGSDAYVPDYTATKTDPDNAHGFYYTNFKGGRILNNSSATELTMVFKRLVPSGHSSTTAFRYQGIKPLQNTLNPSKTINATVYYLDTECNLAAGVSMKIPYETAQPVNSVKLFNNRYSVEIPVSNNDYYFHNKMHTLLQQKKFPVITFEFDINVPKSKYNEMAGKHIEIFNVYLHNIHRYGYCWGGYKPLDDNKNYNMLATILDAQSDQTYILAFITSGHGDGATCWHDMKTHLNVELPFVDQNERISITLTITPTEKIVLCKWTQESQQYFIFKRTATCNDNNNFAKIFREKDGPSHIDDIYIKFPTEYVKNTGTVYLGHTNYLHHYRNTKPNVCILTPDVSRLPDDIDNVYGWSGANDDIAGQNQTPESCRQAALNSGGRYAAWGFRNENHPTPWYKNTCFLYKKPFKPFRGNPNDAAHKTGCLRPGERVEWGCKKYPPLPDNIDKVYGWSGAHVYVDGNDHSEESCRQLALAGNGKYAAWGYRTDEHWMPQWRNTCYLYTAPFQPFAGHSWDLAHTTGCLHPGQRVEWGCKSTPPFKPNNATIRSKRRDNFCLDVAGWGKNNFDRLFMWDCHGGDNQRFTYDDKQQITIKDTGKCLDVLGWGTANGTQVIQYDCHGGTNQTWEYDNQFRLHPRFAPSKCLTVANNSDRNETNVVIEDCHSGENQKWYIQN
jgi:hypothetical protein